MEVSVALSKRGYLPGEVVKILVKVRRDLWGARGRSIERRAHLRAPPRRIRRAARAALRRCSPRRRRAPRTAAAAPAACS
jgi:hypothetical protein